MPFSDAFSGMPFRIRLGTSPRMSLVAWLCATEDVCVDVFNFTSGLRLGDVVGWVFGDGFWGLCWGGYGVDVVRGLLLMLVCGV